MKLMAIDGNSLINRAFYGVRPLSNHEGVPTNALYGFLNMYLKLLQDFAPDYICVCFDTRAKTFRHDKSDFYKAQRKPMPEDLATQFPLIKQALDLMGVPRMELEGFEADDFLGTLARLSKEEGIDCLIVTGDKDSLQYIDQGAEVALVTTKMGQTMTEVYDAARFAEKYSGLTPGKIVDLKAVMGDSSDNIPGIPGIGEKGAMELITHFGSLEEVYRNADDETLSPSIRKKLAEGRELAFLSYDLALGRTDVPIEKPVASLAPANLDGKGLYDFLTEMDLKSIVKRLELKPVTGGERRPESGYKERRFTHAGASEISALLAGDSVPALVLSGDMRLAAFCSEDTLLVASCDTLGQEAWDAMLSGLFASGRYCAHDSKGYILKMLKRGAEAAPPAFDTAVAAYLMAPTKGAYSMEDCALAAFDVECGTPLYDEGQTSLLGGDEEAQAAIARHANIVYGLMGYYKAQLEKNAMLELMKEIELPLIPVLAEMQHTGMLLDAARLTAFGEQLTGDISRLEREIYALAGEEFNIGSPKQLGVVLFERLGLKAAKKTKTGYSTDADVLEKLKGEHAVIPAVLEYRMLTKLRSTYVDGLLRVVGKDGRIHSSFNQMVTATGRLSSTDPNMQNIPVRQELGTEIRRCFVPAPGCKLVDADYSQIELRVLAHIAGDETMLQAFNNNEDIHTVTASQVFEVPLGEVTPQMRSRAKAVNFGIVYGISAFSLSEDIGVFPKQAQGYIDAYLEKYHGVRNYMTGIKNRAAQDGFVTTEFGRKRWLPELKSSNFNVRSFGERVALNTPIQGTAADIMKLAMIRVSRRLKTEKMACRLVLQVHDELILECPEDEIEKAGLLLKEEMEGAAELSVRLAADVGVGDNWYDAK